MAEDPMRLVMLASLANEFEAGVLVNALEAEGIQATAVGGFTSGFRAESPGSVCVMVNRGDLQRAREVLAAAQREQEESEAAQSDRDEEERGEDEEEQPSGGPAEPPRPASRRKHRPFQYSLGTLVGLQILVSVALAICRAGSFSPDAVSVAVALGTLLAIVVATVWIASDMTRARTAWAAVGRMLVLALAAVLLLELIGVVGELVLR